MATQVANPVLQRRLAQKFQKASFVRADHIEEKGFLKKINWLNTLIVFGVPVFALYGIFTAQRQYWQTWVFAIFYYFITGIGITAGYHRLWSHRSYSANLLFQIFLMVGGSGALQGSIKWWSLLHRAHHRWTDSDNDPYNAKRGFFYAHIGWLLLQSVHVKEQVCIDDLRSSRLIRWQHENYHWFGPFMTLIFPSLICGLGWGDFRGGFYVAGFFRVLLVQHATWCVNSVAHWFGKFTFDDTISPRDSILTGLITFGEGYHNFHHEFPNDYRNGTHWWDYDPTKWFIWIASLFGLSFDLNRFPKNEIIKGEIDMEQKILDQKKQGVNYGVCIDKLPEWTQKQVNDKIANGKILIIIYDIIHDVTNFVGEGKHPGGKRIILERNGKISTDDFNGIIYNHSNAARNMAAHMRVAKLVT